MKKRRIRRRRRRRRRENLEKCKESYFSSHVTYIIKLFNI